jgi:hypothetical protein
MVLVPTVTGHLFHPKDSNLILSLIRKMADKSGDNHAKFFAAFQATWARSTYHKHHLVWEAIDPEDLDRAIQSGRKRGGEWGPLVTQFYKSKNDVALP